MGCFRVLTGHAESRFQNLVTEYLLSPIAAAQSCRRQGLLTARSSRQEALLSKFIGYRIQHVVELRVVLQFIRSPMVH